MQTTCDTCGILIAWQPTVIGGRAFCCTGCAEGGPCTCDYGSLPRRDDPAAIVVARRGHELPASPGDVAPPA